jgi:hypothetical protein
MNKIISISVWGDNPRYLVGAKRQYELAKQLLPDWEFRLYVDDASKYDMPDANIIEVKDATHGVFWRFEPLFESDENVVIVRDADSRITLRERRAVLEWYFSEKKFHTIVDHDSHFQFPIMAGLFGNKGRLSHNLYETMAQLSQAPAYYTIDQVYLRDHVFPVMRNSMLVHSFYKNAWFGQTRAKLKNRFDFCGNGYDENDMPLYPPTLHECAGFDPKNVDPKFKFNYGVLDE